MYAFSMQLALWMVLLYSLQDPVDPCPGETGNITKYQISFGTKHTVDTQNVNTARCTNGRCSNTFVPPSSLPYYSVSASAENVVGVGAARTCTTQDISKCPVKYFRVNIL